MRVLVDAHMVGQHETGNETYIINLLRNLSARSEVECGAVVTSAMPAGTDLGTAHLIHLSPPGDLSRLLFALPQASRTWHADVLHCTYVAPFVLPCPLVVSVHDISFKRYPRFFSPRDRLLFATLLPVTLRRARAVIAISEHSKQEILSIFPHLHGKVYVTHLAPSPEFRQIRDKDILQAAKSRYGIHSDFLLAVGNLQPRKNLVRLIEAFATVCSQIESLQLVIVGKAQWQASVLYDTVAQFGLQNHVVFAGSVPDQDLVLLYNSARAFVYPSIYEGFGLPVLEAMACGTPVVASNTSSIPEVAGDAAALVNPHQGQQIAAAILQILTEPEWASHLSDAGMMRARMFSWHKTALETVGVYRKVLAQSMRIS